MKQFDIVIQKPVKQTWNNCDIIWHNCDLMCIIALKWHNLKQGPLSLLISGSCQMGATCTHPLPASLADGGRWARRPGGRSFSGWLHLSSFPTWPWLLVVVVSTPWPPHIMICPGHWRHWPQSPESRSTRARQRAGCKLKKWSQHHMVSYAEYMISFGTLQWLHYHMVHCKHCNDIAMTLYALATSYKTYYVVCNVVCANGKNRLKTYVILLFDDIVYNIIRLTYYTVYEIII